MRWARATLALAIAMVAAPVGAQESQPTAAPHPVRTIELANARHAAPCQQWICVAAGADGVLVVDVDIGAVQRAIELPGAVQHVAAADQTIYATAHTAGADSAIHVVNFADGALVRTIPIVDGGANNGVAVLAEDRIAAVTSGAVIVFRPSTGEELGRVELPGGVHHEFDLVGTQLYVARSYAGGLTVVDTETLAPARVIETEDWLWRVRVSGDRAYVWGDFYGLGVIDLSARAPVPLTGHSELGGVYHFHPVDDGTVYFASPQGVVHAGADFSAIARWPLSLGDGSGGYDGFVSVDEARIVLFDGDLHVIER